MTFFRGKFGSFVAFLGIAALVAGGLGWVTREALQMEEERLLAARTREQEKLQLEHDEWRTERIRQAEMERSEKMRRALLLLDNRLTPALAREDSRPYPQYLALYSPFPAVAQSGVACLPGEVFLPSPLITADLPDWMLLHFQVDPVKGWISPQVIPEETQKMLRKQPIELALNNVDQSHRDRLDELRHSYPPKRFLELLRERGVIYDNGQINPQEPNPFVTNNSYNTGNFNGGNGVNPPNGFGQLGMPNGLGQLGMPSGLGQLGVPNGQGQQGYAPNSPTNQAAQGQNFDKFNNDLQETARRFQNTRSAMNEGLWAFLSDGRNYSSTPLDYLSTSKAMYAKQAEARSIEKQLQNSPAPVTQKNLQTRLEVLKKEVEELKKVISQPVEVELGSMKPIWLPDHEKPKHLIIGRPVRVGQKFVYQGILLDWTKLQEILRASIEEVIPDAKFIPRQQTDPARLDREMYVLPVELDPGPINYPEEQPVPRAAESASVRWTPLRVGLALAWAAALMALAAVGLGGWSLLDLSERRIRFVSAVTHELRTPLTTLRLYLDLLVSGMVSEERQRDEYIKTLSGEADRLHRLIGNVLDFARLEKTRPAVEKLPVPVADLVEQLRSTWNEHCAACGKELRIASAISPELIVNTDRKLVEQILGNLIDNARKYSRDAVEPAIWIRVLTENGKVAIEIEDRGPGVTKRERGSIFRPFRRGRDADVKAGGVGLGLALATRWASFIGGKLSVTAGQGGIGACFRLELPG